MLLNSDTNSKNPDFIFDNLQLDGHDQEEIEAQKILTKRQRRLGKVEDVSIDIDHLIQSRKRFKPALSEVSTSSSDSQIDQLQVARSNLQNEKMKQILKLNIES